MTTKAIVIDASVAGRWLTSKTVSDELVHLYERALQSTMVVPSLFRYEVANLLATHARISKIDLTQRALALVVRWPLMVDMKTPSIDSHIRTALETGLSAYDTAYLEVALRRNLPIATVDRKLAKAARAAGVEVLP
jgi:predicted nucleic acid-binding protein